MIETITVTKDSFEDLRETALRIKSERDSCIAALEQIIADGLDEQGTASAALWNNGDPIGKYKA